MTIASVKVRGHAHLYRTFAEESFVRHTSMIHGDQTKAPVLARKFPGVEAVVVE